MCSASPAFSCQIDFNYRRPEFRHRSLLCAYNLSTSVASRWMVEQESQSTEKQVAERLLQVSRAGERGSRVGGCCSSMLPRGPPTQQSRYIMMHRPMLREGDSGCSRWGAGSSARRE